MLKLNHVDSSFNKMKQKLKINTKYWKRVKSRKVVIWAENDPIKLPNYLLAIFHLSSHLPSPRIVKDDWYRGKKFLWPHINFTKSGEAHSVNIVMGESRGGCGVGGLNSLWCWQKEPLHWRGRGSKSAGLKGGEAVLESLLCLGGIQLTVVCIDVEHLSKTHFPILIFSCPVEVKRVVLQKHSFIKDTTKLSFAVSPPPFFFQVQHLCSSDEYYVSVCTAEEPTESDWLEVIPERGRKRKDAG